MKIWRKQWLGVEIEVLGKRGRVLVEHWESRGEKSVLHWEGVIRLVEFVGEAQRDVESGGVESVAAGIAVSWFFVEPAADRLGPDGAQAFGSEHAEHPRQHDLLMDFLRVP